MSLSWISAYYEPITHFVDSDYSNSIVYYIAIGITAVGTVLMYLGVLDEVEDEAVNYRLEFISSFWEWFTLLGWWYPLDTSFETFYSSGGWLSTETDTVAAFLFAITLAIFITMFLATLAASVSITFRDHLMGENDPLPAWLGLIGDDKKDKEEESRTSETMGLISGEEKGPIEAK
jgi:hypothetical protein